MSDLIADAREYVESLSGRQLVTAGWTLTLDCFPGGFQGSARMGGLPQAWFSPRPAGNGGEQLSIRMPKAPLQSVSAVTYYDMAGVLQTLPTTTYDVDATKDPGLFSLAQYQIWPLTRLRPGAVQIAFTAGYGAAPSVPGVYRRAIRMLVAFWYEHRGEDDASICDAVETLLLSGWNGELEYGE